jgi:serine/threonine-protein kinase HipA
MILPPEATPATIEEGAERLSVEQIDGLSKGTAVVQALATKRARLSLAGAQGKLPVIVEGNDIFLPQGRTASTHILKLPSTRLKNIAVNELFMLRLGKAVGIPTVDANLLRIKKDYALVVKRFDRHDGKRIHQEDFCQATDRSPKTKYEEEGGPTFAQIVAVIREESTTPAPDVDVALRWLIFNVLTGNADGHGKNLALLRADAIRLAPVYDLVCTRYWPQFGREIAMSVIGARDPGHIGANAWRALSKSATLGTPLVLRRVNEMIEVLPDAARDVADVLHKDGIRRGPVNAIPDIIVKLCRRAKSLMSAQTK